MGASRSFPSWYPLSRNCCPNTFRMGQPIWQAEHGNPYFLAKAGIAWLDWLLTSKNEDRKIATLKIDLASWWPMKRTERLASLDLILPPTQFSLSDGFSLETGAFDGSRKADRKRGRSISGRRAIGTDGRFRLFGDLLSLKARSSAPPAKKNFSRPLENYWMLPDRHSTNVGTGCKF